MRNLSIVALACVFALIASGCGGSAGDSGDGGDGGEQDVVSGGTFTMTLHGDPGALDPATAVLGATNMLLSFAYDTLVYQDAEGTIVPGLAEEWEVTPNSVTFTLRDGVTCADGSEVTPTVVADSINHLVAPETKSPLLGVVVPADVTAAADDAAGTVTLTTKAPSPFLLQAMVAVFIVCGEGLEDRSVLEDGTSGSGPFTLTEAVPSDHYTLKVRDGYAWGPDGATTDTEGVPDTVVLKVVTSESTAVNLLLSGDVNAVKLTGADRARVENRPDVDTLQIPGGNEDIFYHQAADRPTAALEVRTALTQALDLGELANIVSANTGKDTTGLITLAPDPCRDDSVSGHLPEHDLEAAKAALDAAGWQAGPDGIRVKDGKKLSLRLLFLTSEGQGTQAAAEYMAAQWKKLGVETTLKGEVDTKYGESLFTTGDWDAALVGLGLGMPSQLIGYLSGPIPPEGGSNFAHLDNPRYGELIAEAAQTPSTGGCAKWAEAESVLFDNVDVVPVVEATQLLATKGAEIFVTGGFAQPTSIRMLAS